MAASTASAAEVHPFVETFGSSGQPTFGGAEGLAIDQSSGDLYVIDGATNSVRRYNPDGTPDDFSALATNVIDGQGAGDETPQGGLGFGGANEVQVAVDASGGATDGNIYVTQSGAHLIDIFAEDGTYLGQLTAAGAVPFGEACGVAVDSAGAVYVGDYSFGVHKFVPTGSSPVDADNVANFSHPQTCSVSTGAGPTAGFIFATEYNGATLKLDSANGNVAFAVDSGPNTTAAVDPASGYVYVAKETEVGEYDASGAGGAIPLVGIEFSSRPAGLAIYGTESRLFGARSGFTRIEVFGLGSLVAVPDASTEAATSISRTTARLNGRINADGGPAASCEFQYTTEESFEVEGFAGATSVSCVPPGPFSGTSTESVSAEAAGLSAAKVYRFRVVGTNENGSGRGEVLSFETNSAVNVGTGSASNIASHSSRLNGAINPEGGAVQECTFEYGRFFYGEAVPCVETPAQIGEGEEPKAVHADVSGLDAFTSYHFRLTATNAFGTTSGADREFQTALPPLPTATTDGADVAGPLATLRGRVNPTGAAITDCRFLYGATSAYGQSVPCDQSPASLGAGTGDEPVVAETEPLAANTVYHFRLRASNVAGAAQGKDRTFLTGSAPADSCPNADIRAAQGTGTLLLPDCMALEQVSPPEKAQQWARGPSVSVGGDRILFKSIATLGNSPGRGSPFGDDYVATRGPSGWETASTAPQSPIVAGSNWAQNYSPDFSSWFHIGSTADQEGLGVAQAFQAGLGGAFSPLSPLLTPVTGAGGAIIVTSSPDHSALYFETAGTGVVDAGAKATSFLPGDPQPNGVGEDNNLYVTKLGPAGQASVALLARDRTGKAWGANCGARLGGFEEVNGSDLYLPNGRRTQGAVSPTGSLVYFSTRPDQPESGDCLPSSKMRIMKREETASGSDIAELFQSECDRVTPTPCSNVAGDDVYQGASIDQTRVYFTTNRQLANTDRDGNATSCSNEAAVPGCDLYLYDSIKPVGQRLTQVSAGDGSASTPGEGADVNNSITAISADGSHVYFVARTILTTHPNPEGDIAENDTNNLYVYNADSRQLAFVGSLAPGDGGSFTAAFLFGGSGTWSNDAYPVPVLGVNPQGEQVGGNGHILLFRSKASLTADDGDASRDLFRYDADSQTLERVSRAGPGGADNGEFDVTHAQAPESSTEFSATGRWVSENGEAVVFTTAEPLLPGDRNGVEDSYMWRNGDIFRLPGSAKTGLGSIAANQPTVSADGLTAAYTSNQALLPSDGDSVEDVYVARVDGGYQMSPAEPTCEGEACQGAPVQPAGSISAASAQFTGRGNPRNPAPKARCRRGKWRKHGKCVTKRGKKHHGQSPAREVGHDRGGAR
jgi:hypothetical protein